MCEILWGGGKFFILELYCSKNCLMKYIIILEIINVCCCWWCESCSFNYVIINNMCFLCGKGKLLDVNFIKCFKLFVVYLFWKDIFV